MSSIPNSLIQPLISSLIVFKNLLISFSGEGDEIAVNPLAEEINTSWARTILSILRMINLSISYIPIDLAFSPMIGRIAGSLEPPSPVESTIAPSKPKLTTNLNKLSTLSKLSSSKNIPESSILLDIETIIPSISASFNPPRDPKFKTTPAHSFT